MCARLDFDLCHGLFVFFLQGVTFLLVVLPVIVAVPVERHVSGDGIILLFLFYFIFS